MSTQTRMNRSIARTALSLLVTALSSAALAAPATPAIDAPKFDSGVISGLGARNIGSATMSGRISAVAAMAEKDGKTLLIVGAASGGVWKSTDSGTTFKSVFDKQPVQSIGSIAIDPSNHETIWVGTGESWTRNSVSIGGGHLQVDRRRRDLGERGSQGFRAHLQSARRSARRQHGLRVRGPASSGATRRIAACTRRPTAAKTWSLVLKGRNLSTGCSSISLDPKDSNTIFASLWDFRRKGWTFRSGGDSAEKPSGSGLFRSSDGGKSWTEITDAANKGFPKKPYGRLAVAVAPSASNVVMRSSNRPIRHSIARTTAAGPGTSATRASSWSGVRSTSPISSWIRSIPIACSSLTSISS